MDREPIPMEAPAGNEPNPLDTPEGREEYERWLEVVASYDEHPEPDLNQAQPF